MGVGMFMLAWEHNEKEEEPCLKLNLVWKPKPSFDFGQSVRWGEKSKWGAVLQRFRLKRVSGIRLLEE